MFFTVQYPKLQLNKQKQALNVCSVYNYASDCETDHCKNNCSTNMLCLHYKIIMYVVSS